MVSRGGEGFRDGGRREFDERGSSSEGVDARGEAGRPRLSWGDEVEQGQGWDRSVEGGEFGKWGGRGGVGEREPGEMSWGPSREAGVFGAVGVGGGGVVGESIRVRCWVCEVGRGGGRDGRCTECRLETLEDITVSWREEVKVEWEKAIQEVEGKWEGRLEGLGDMVRGIGEIMGRVGDVLNGIEQRVPGEGDLSREILSLRGLVRQVEERVKGAMGAGAGRGGGGVVRGHPQGPLRREW